MNTNSSTKRTNTSLNKLISYLRKSFIEEKMNNLIGFTTIGLFCFLAALIISKVGVIAGIFLGVALIGIPIVILGLLNIKLGFLLAIFFAYFIFHFNRMVGMYDLQTGVLIELFLITATVGILFGKNREQGLMKQFSNPVSFAVLTFFIYYLTQAFNPNALNLSGWLFILRGAIGMLLIYVVSMHAFSSLEFVITFTKFWFFLAFLVAVYGIYQEMYGFTEFENRWIYSSEMSFRLAFIWGRFRRMSFMSDAATFGIYMAYTGVAALILSMGPYSYKKRIFAFISSVLMFISMNYSGTRTAYAAVPVGISLFILMSANNRRTFIFGMLVSVSIIFILFGPIQSSALVRLRSTFEAEEDASFIVRENNRHGIQPYMLSHPMGGGVATTGLMGVRFSPNHPLANFPSDSGMVKTVLEMGWIGLILEYGMYFTVLAIGIINYFKVKNPTIKNLYLMYLACFFAMTIANFAQVTMGQRPMNILFYATFALVIKLKVIDDKLNESLEKHC